jgi:hypothetical protein
MSGTRKLFPAGWTFPDSGVERGGRAKGAQDGNQGDARAKRGTDYHVHVWWVKPRQ